MYVLYTAWDCRLFIPCFHTTLRRFFKVKKEKNDLIVNKKYEILASPRLRLVSGEGNGKTVAEMLPERSRRGAEAPLILYFLWLCTLRLRSGKQREIAPLPLKTVKNKYKKIK